MPGPVRTAPVVPTSRSTKSPSIVQNYSRLFENRRCFSTDSDSSNSQFFIDPWAEPTKTPAPAVKSKERPPPRPPQPKNFRVSSAKSARSENGTLLIDLTTDLSNSRSVHKHSSGALFGSASSLVWDRPVQSVPTSSQSARASPTCPLNGAAHTGSWSDAESIGVEKAQRSGSRVGCALPRNPSRPTIIRPAMLPSSSSQNSLSTRSEYAPATVGGQVATRSCGGSWGTGINRSSITDGLSLLGKTVQPGYNSWGSDYPSSAPPTTAPPMPPLDQLLGPKSRTPASQQIPAAEALHDFSSHEAGDLSFVAGERIVLLERLNDEWLRGRLDGPRAGPEGIFPSNHVRIIVPLPDAPVVDVSGDEHVEEQRCDARLGGTVKQPDTGGFDGIRSMALYDFQTDVEGDLHFSNGDFVMVMGKLNEDWGYGNRRGCSGQFPLCYVDVDADRLPTL